MRVAGRDAGSDVDPLEVAITGRTLQGQEAERSRLAREVHDGPAQVLANAIMGLEYCESLTEKRPQSVPTELQRLKAGQ
jgi:two-component system sensor histidine kinase DegS